MGTQLNKIAYQKLIDENIEAINKYMPEHSLEKKHIQEVLRCSIECYYPSEGNELKREKANEISPHVRASYLQDAYDICEQMWDFLGNVIGSDGDEALQSDIDKYNKSKRYCKWFNSL